MVLGGVAVELVHLGSLYHDDVIDEAVTRRGVESVNARWGNLRAILSGDLLLARASEIAASLGTEVAALLAATIGQLCEGEVLELQDAFQVDRTEASYLASIEGKTASLFSAAARIGALVADLPRDRRRAAHQLRQRYGTAFQIVDDMLDLVATDEQLGKPAGHDLVEGVYTLPVLRALDAPGGERAARAARRPSRRGRLPTGARRRPSRSWHRFRDRHCGTVRRRCRRPPRTARRSSVGAGTAGGVRRPAGQSGRVESTGRPVPVVPARSAGSSAGRPQSSGAAMLYDLTHRQASGQVRSAVLEVR